MCAVSSPIEQTEAVQKICEDCPQQGSGCHLVLLMHHAASGRIVLSCASESIHNNVIILSLA